MWQIVSTKGHAAGRHRARSKGGKHHRGFSHPARFEILEERLPLTAPAGGNAQLGTAADFGTSDLGGFLMAQNGLEPLPGSASEANGNDPAQIALVGVYGTPDPTFLRPGNDYLAFNNPSWIPNDRTLTPVPFTNDTDLPMNVYQTVRSPRGIRNFEIGANTSMAHGNVSPVGPTTPTASKPVPVAPKFGQVIEHPLDEGLLSAVDDARDKTEAREQKPAETESPVAPTVLAAPRAAEIDEMPKIAPHEVAVVAACAQLDEAAVDRTMAEADDVRTPASKPLGEPSAEEEAPLYVRGEEVGIQAMAASLALAATISVQRPGTGTSLTELVVRAAKKPWPPQRDSHGKKHRNHR